MLFVPFRTGLEPEEFGAPANVAPRTRDPSEVQVAPAWIGVLASGRYLLLIDALDEVADAAHRANVLTALTHVATAGACRIVVSTRPTRHTGAELPEGFLRVGIARLDEAQRAAMVERWSTARHYADGEQAATSDMRTKGGAEAGRRTVQRV